MCVYEGDSKSKVDVSQQGMAIRGSQRDSSTQFEHCWGMVSYVR